jgi:hypothetical protein
MFVPPKPDEQGTYHLKDFSVAGLTDLRNLAANDHTSLVASMKDAGVEQVSDEQLDRAEELQAFVAAADAELDNRAKRAQRATAAATLPERPQPQPQTQPEETVTADGGFDADGNKDVAETTPAIEVANTVTEVVDATVTASGGTDNAPRRSVQIADVAPHVPTETTSTMREAAPYTIVAAADISTFPTGTELSWQDVGKAFEERVRAYPTGSRGAGKVRLQHSLARIRRDFPESQVVLEGDSHQAAFDKLRNTAEASVKQDALVAANGWCAPSEPDYSICSPITADGLLSIPETVLRRGGLLHNQGLDFADFFGGDFTLPITGYNILTEAEVIADTAKTCVEIPCPSFVDDRLNVAALCITSSLLQNRGYPEFVSEFTQGAIAAMAHLVNREVINEIVTGSTAVTQFLTVDPWATDGTFYSNVLSAAEFAVKDMRYAYRTSMTQMFDGVFPYWLLGAMRADYIRQNARVTDDLADANIIAQFRMRGIDPQFVYDWQDAFNPGALSAAHQLGHATPPFNYPTTTQFLIFLPGTWVLGRQDVIRLDTVYDSTNLQQNLVTQLFLEDGFKPMRMCQLSRVYSIPTCANGHTGSQRTITCTDVTP